MRRLLGLLAVLLATPLDAQAVATGKLTVAGQAFAAADVLDARAMPDLNGKAGVMLTLSPAAAKRLATITAGLAGKPMIVALDGKTLLAEMIRSPIRDGVIELPARVSLPEAEALAKRISGKDPLPDDLAE